MNVYASIFKKRNPHTDADPAQKRRERMMRDLVLKARVKKERLMQRSDDPHPRLFAPRVDTRSNEVHMRNAHQRGLIVEEHVRAMNKNENACFDYVELTRRMPW